MDETPARVGGRMVKFSAAFRFFTSQPIPNGSVSCALHALLAIGLLRHTESHFTFPPGYYPMESVFLLLAYLALGRVPSLEHIPLRSSTFLPGQHV